MSLTSYRAAPPRVTHLTYAEPARIATGICPKIAKCFQKLEIREYPVVFNFQGTSGESATLRWRFVHPLVTA